MTSARSAMRRVVVTGLGAVTAAGQTVPDLWASIKAARSGLKPIEKFYQNHPHFIARSAITDWDMKCEIAGQVEPFDQRARLAGTKRDKLIQLADRYSLFAATAAAEAMAQAGLAFPLADPYRAACIVGSAAGGVINVEAAYRHIFEFKNPASHPLTLIRTIGSSAAAHVGIEYGMKGPTFAVCGDFASGSDALAVAAGYIRSGVVDVALAGASDAPVAYTFMRFWEAAGWLSPEGLHPFAEGRGGTVLGEGAGLMVLEELEHARARGATILAEFCGSGATADAVDMTSPDPAAAAAAMQAALDDAGLDAGAIDYINASGVGTEANDLAEAEAIRALLGARAGAVPVSGTKGIYGNAVGAASAIDAIVCVKALAEGWIPSTAGVAKIDSRIGLDIVTGLQGRRKPLGHVMSNAFGMTGLNSSLVLGPPPA